MTLTKKLKDSVLIITVTFYAFLMVIPSFVLRDFADFQVYKDFFFNRNMNILLCIAPVALGFLMHRTDIKNKGLFLALADSLILFLIYTEFFVSANYHILLLTAIFILIFVLININEFLSLAGIIPFFFLSDLDTFHYVLIVALPLVFLLAIKRRHTENKAKKTALTITLFIQCYICIFFVALVVTDLYWFNITALLPQHITTEYIIKTAALIILMLIVTVCFIINVFRRSEKISEKLILTVAAIILLSLSIAGYFTDILSTVNKTSVIISLIYFVIFSIQHGICVPAEKDCKPKAADIIAISSFVLFTVGMMN